jgi:hypothetical protein
MRVLLPPEVRTLLERPIQELCHRADVVYRKEAQRDNSRRHARVSDATNIGTKVLTDASNVGTALIAAALDAGEHEGFLRVMEKLRSLEPDLAAALGW